MTSDAITTFIAGYLQSLSEETRKDRKGARFGFDQIVLQLAQAEKWIRLRLAFHRGGRKGDPTPKKEAEHGIDLKFLSRDGSSLIVFVLKDEPLTYKNWEREKIHSDLSRASEQDLNSPELRGVKKVRLILAYNKGDEEEGIEEFERFAASRGNRIGVQAKITFERWNLEVLTDRVQEKLLNSPGIVPERFFQSFSYLCSQVADFSHGSTQWQDVLLPDWREFLQEVLEKPVNERSVRLISVALLVLQSQGKSDPSFETGWIELVELAAIALWRVEQKTKSKKVKNIVAEIWIRFYLTSLEEFYEKNSALLHIQHSLAVDAYIGFGEATASFYTYWHLARLGILAFSFVELGQSDKPAANKIFRATFHRVVGWIVGLINANPAAFRPVLDIHHIELFLLWRVMRCAGRLDEIYDVFATIHQRLLFRRLGNGDIRVIDQSNSWEQLFEFLATGEKPNEAFGRSSYLLQMLIEISVHGIGPNGPALAEAIYKHLIEGKGDDGQSFGFAEHVELQSWVPPDNWVERLLEGSVCNEGICITVNSYYHPGDEERGDLQARIESFVEQTRLAHPFKEPKGIPATALVLASILHHSPIPPEFWRYGLYKPTSSITSKKAKRRNERSPSGPQ